MQWMKDERNASFRRVAEASRREFLKNATLGFSAVIGAAQTIKAATRDGENRLIREDSPKLKIGVFDAGFPDLPLDQLIEMIKEFRIEAIEIGSGNDPGSAHCD